MRLLAFSVARHKGNGEFNIAIYVEKGTATGILFVLRSRPIFFYEFLNGKIARLSPDGGSRVDFS